MSASQPPHPFVVPALFPPWSDSALRLGLGALALAVPGAFVLPMIYVRTPYNQERLGERLQPVQFDHRHHVRDDGIACLYCHDLAERSSSAGLPAAEVCMGCHSQIWNESPTLAPVRRSYFSGEPLAWKRVHHVPDFVYFDHSVHVRGGIDCVVCHGDVTAMPLDRKVRSFTMGWCLDCHRQHRARADLPGATVATASAERETQMAHLHPVSALETCTACHR